MSYRTPVCADRGRTSCADRGQPWTRIAFPIERGKIDFVKAWGPVAALRVVGQIHRLGPVAGHGHDAWASQPRCQAALLEALDGHVLRALLLCTFSGLFLNGLQDLGELLDRGVELGSVRLAICAALVCIKLPVGGEVVEGLHNTIMICLLFGDELGEGLRGRRLTHGGSGDRR